MAVIKINKDEFYTLSNALKVAKYRRKIDYRAYEKKGDKDGMNRMFNYIEQSEALLEKLKTYYFK